MAAQTLGMGTFLPAPKLDDPTPFEQPCIVTALFEDGTANVVAFGVCGEVRTYERVKFVDASGNVSAHYEPVPLVDG